MKVTKLILPLLAVFMLATGCTKEYYGSQIETYQFNVNPGDWSRNQGQNLPGANNYLYCEKAAWNTLPFVYPLEIYVTNDEGNTEMIVVPENLRFEWELGKVTIIIQDLDGYDPESMELAGPISFKVCVTRNM